MPSTSSYQHDYRYEGSSLLKRSDLSDNDKRDSLDRIANSNNSVASKNQSIKAGFLVAVAFAVILFAAHSQHPPPTEATFSVTTSQEEHIATKNVVERLGKGHNQKWAKKYKKEKKHHKHITYLSQWAPPPAQPRCDWVMNVFAERDAGTPPEDLEITYKAQCVDPNVFYRATAHIFWKDFALGDWMRGFTQIFLLHNDPDSDDSDEEVDDDPDNKQELDGAPLTPRSVWTWVTGDQHLSNFGAWRNRHGDIVFGVNDFDEAAIYDFQIDVIRIAVSITSHAVTNGLSEEEVDRAVMVFTDSYISTILDYEDNEEALLFELTPKTAYGSLKNFLEKVEKKKSSEKQMTKFTTHDPTTRKRHFIKGPINIPNEDTHLASVPPEMVAQIKQAFNNSHYGASMMKLGWAVVPWDDDFYEVLDVAERVGSGIGSYGVDRYYILLKGKDGLLLDSGEEGQSVILDVKYQPKSAVTRILDEDGAAWYGHLFANEAARVVEAQRRLTSYTDPYTGWITLRNLDPEDKTFGEDQAFSIRQRSPWKDSPDLGKLTKPDDFNDFVAQIAAATATSHVRGSVAKAPGDFKHVIATVLGGSSHKLHEWGEVITKVAHAYRSQVLMDFDCFRSSVKERYGDIPDIEEED